MLTECWALRHGLSLAIQLGIQNLEVKLDTRVVVDLINSTSQTNAAFTTLLLDCRLLLSKIPHARVSHVFREANYIANALARNCSTMEEDFCVFYQPQTLLRSCYALMLIGLAIVGFQPRT